MYKKIGIILLGWVMLATLLSADAISERLAQSRQQIDQITESAMHTSNDTDRWKTLAWVFAGTSIINFILAIWALSALYHWKKETSFSKDFTAEDAFSLKEQMAIMVDDCQYMDQKIGKNLQRWQETYLQLVKTLDKKMRHTEMQLQAWEERLNRYGLLIENVEQERQIEALPEREKRHLKMYGLYQKGYSVEQIAETCQTDLKEVELVIRIFEAKMNGGN